MRIELQTARGEAVRELEIPTMTPWPSVITWGARTFMLMIVHHDRLTCREVLAISAEGYLPGGGVEDLARVERA